MLKQKVVLVYPIYRIQMVQIQYWLIENFDISQIIS